MRPAVIAFSGPIASGKTTISLEVSRELGWKYASFGDFVRKEASVRGLDFTSRKILQEIGSELIAEGWVSFCSTVLSDAQWKEGEGLVIDGIRHTEALNTLREIVYPLSIILVYVSASMELRESRYLGKKKSDETLSSIEKHPTEVQVGETLMKDADLIVDSALPLRYLTEIIIRWLLHRKKISGSEAA